jgi:hypothetical protein
MKAQIRKTARMMAGWPFIGRFVRIAVAVIRLPEFRAEHLDLSHRQHVVETEKLLTLMHTLSEINHRQHVVETEKLPTLMHTLSEINRQLTDAYLDLSHRQHILETEKLPALLHDSDNLVKSVPFALRKITRDWVEMKANLERLSRRLEEAGLVDAAVIDLASNNDIRHDLETEAIKSSDLK